MTVISRLKAWFAQPGLGIAFDVGVVLVSWTIAILNGNGLLYFEAVLVTYGVAVVNPWRKANGLEGGIPPDRAPLPELVARFRKSRRSTGQAPTPPSHRY